MRLVMSYVGDFNIKYLFKVDPAGQMWVEYDDGLHRSGWTEADLRARWALLNPQYPATWHGCSRRRA